MRNPITYTKEDIYMIVDMAEYMESLEGILLPEYKKFVDGLIECLTLEEQEDEIIQRYKETIKESYKDWEE